MKPMKPRDMPDRPAGTAAVPEAGRRLRDRLSRRLLRVSLFYKLFLANATIIALFGVAAVLLTTRAVSLGGLAPVAAVEVIGLLALGLTALANAFVIRLALSPLSALEDTARLVRQGDLRARVPSSPLADADLEGVIQLFNEVLDVIEADRARRTELSLRVLQAEERERERVARELYAGVAQTLAGVLVRMRMVDRIRELRQGISVLEEVRDEVARALDEVRLVARQLRPPELDELGVLAALEAHARHLTDDGRTRVCFEGNVPEDSLSADGSLALFRIVQEALSNAILHAGGMRVRVSFTPTWRGLLTEIADDGRGFDTDRALLAGSGGLGLLGMRERAGYVGGTLSVESAPGDGARVLLLVPWAAERPYDLPPGAVVARRNGRGDGARDAVGPREPLDATSSPVRRSEA